MITINEELFELEDGLYIVYVNVFQGHVTNVIYTTVFQLEITYSDDNHLANFLEEKLETPEFTITGIVKGTSRERATVSE